MGAELIRGVFFYPLTPIVTTGGRVLHAIKGTDEHLAAFGECYFSTAEPNAPKAWKQHTKMTCNLFVPLGSVRFVFYDDREESSDYKKIRELEISGKNYGRLVIQPGIWFGFSGTGEGESLVLNVADMAHDAGESLRLEPGSAAIPYEWKFDR